MTPLGTLNRKMLLVLSTGFILSACSILYELNIAKAISTLAGNGVLWESITIGTYVGSLGLGVWLATRFNALNPSLLLLWVELGLTCVGSGAIVLIYALHVLYRIYIFDGGILGDYLLVAPIVWFGIASQSVTILVGILSGVELPTFLKIAKNHYAGDSTGICLGFYYFGTLAGTLAFALVFSSYLGQVMTGVITATLNLLALVPIALISRSELISKKATLWATFSVSVLFACSAVSPALTTIRIKNFYYNVFSWEMSPEGLMTFRNPIGIGGLIEYLNDLPEIQSIRTKIQTIDIVPNASVDPTVQSKQPENVRPFRLYLDGNFQFSSQTEVDYHEHMAHVPMFLHNLIPKHVLILGAGDGLLTRELLRYGDRIESITLVEYDEAMIDYSRSNSEMKVLNQEALSNPKVKIVIADAFAFLRQDLSQYDAVYIDLPYPFSYDASRLYSVECLRMVANRLSPDGFVTLDAPFDFESPVNTPTNLVVFNTMFYAGFKTIAAFQGSPETFVTASKIPKALTFQVPDLKIVYATIPLRYFELVDWRMFAENPDRRFVNSIIRPKMMVVSNPRF